MLKKILSPSDCASCKFCCSFRRQSLWETPIFTEDSKEKLSNLYPFAKFRPITISPLKQSFFTIDLLNSYQTNDPEEEAPCPFLKDGTGCILPQNLKPFDCSIWPLRVVKSSSQDLSIVLTPTCKAINKLPLETVSSFVHNELEKNILSYAKNHPEIIKDNSSFFKAL